MRGARAASARRRRGGMTLLEVLVVVAIALALLAVGIPVASSMFSLKQRAAAKDLALTYELIQQEAVLRNQTFRVAYHLDGGWYQVEMGDPDSLIFSNPDDRLEFERTRESKLRRHDDGATAADDPTGGFEGIATKRQVKIELPPNTVFGGVWTPQYERMVRPSGREEDPDEPLVVYSYVFPTGYSEPAVVHLVTEGDDRSGFSVIVEPMSGRVRLTTELIEPREAFERVPDEGPELPQ